MAPSRHAILFHGSLIRGRASSIDEWKMFFGVSPNVILFLWWLCGFDQDPNVTVERLLWALLFIKVYGTEPVLGGLTGVTRKTYRKWVWYILPLIAAAKPDVVSCLLSSDIFVFDSHISQIAWRNRFRNDKGRTCLTTVDCFDLKIHEQLTAAQSSKSKNRRRNKRDKSGHQITCDLRWYSQKHRGPGVKYEVAVCIQTGDIVWFRGPFPCGQWSDKKIFTNKLIHCLDDDREEMVEADGHYTGYPFHIRMPKDYLSESDKVAKAIARARHETVNRKITSFGVMSHTFRHPLSKHKVCADAVAVCVQSAIECGEKPFQVNY
ncbi:unknown protein [Seminavis robusta]|uniref:DDE Tnp4 domain-containing protein n=1 Tax=Seminavis robusta TaxID=568900 RepID=A0A9N8H5Q7_9STRA|nr:unknown protein [Seminavis robusta]|eukprot:Sro80_g043190.1 n/a (321) ;mRNA; f:82590-83552